MSSFRDQVNEKLRKEEKEPISIETALINEAVDLAKMFRNSILHSAEDHTKHFKEGDFSYDGILMFSPGGIIFNETDYVYSGFLEKKRERTFSLNEYADIFLTKLRECLQQDDITVSEWKVATLDEDCIGYINNVYIQVGTEEKTHFCFGGEIKPFYKFRQEPISFSGKIKRVEKENRSKYWDDYWYYDNKCIGGTGKFVVGYVCLLVSFR